MRSHVTVPDSTNCWYTSLQYRAHWGCINMRIKWIKIGKTLSLLSAFQGQNLSRTRLEGYTLWSTLRFQRCSSHHITGVNVSRADEWFSSWWKVGVMVWLPFSVSFQQETIWWGKNDNHFNYIQHTIHICSIHRMLGSQYYLHWWMLKHIHKLIWIELVCRMKLGS
jgi:hypothetical protein